MRARTPTPLCVGTKAGLPAITAAIAAGISINVTLIFSIERYRQVMDAYQTGVPLDAMVSGAARLFRCTP